MKRSIGVFAAASIAFAAGIAYADFPMMNMVADKVAAPIANKMFECGLIP